MKYLPHLDGLRSIAVMAVILFHLDLSPLTGGYVGVDIFFVLSGFLISGLIIGELEQTGDFSFKRFYLRRIHRLAPALLFTLLLTTIAALIILQPNQLREYGQELASSILSVSNFLFWSSSGYFDTNSDMRLLLHTWSLSVEEQFYVFWPAIIYLTMKSYKNNRLTIPALIFFVFCLSFVANIFFLRYEVGGFVNQSEAVFFLMPFRIFEFAIGTLAYWQLKTIELGHLSQNVSSLIGLALIAYSILFFDASTPFPDWNALLPCLGTFFLIISKGSVVSRSILASRPLVWTGLISYSLYLVHWPIIVLLKQWTLGELSVELKVLAFILTFVLAIISYRYIETPLRRIAPNKTCGLPSFNTSFVKTILGLVGFASVCGLLLVQTQGLEHFKDPVLTQKKITLGKAQRYQVVKESCSLGKTNSEYCDFSKEIQVLFYGNSHEVDGFNAFKFAFGNNRNVNFTNFGNSNKCKIQVSNEDGFSSSVKARGCAKRVEEMNKESFIQQLDVIIYSSHRPFNKNKKADWQLLQNITKRNPKTKVIVLGGYFYTIHDCTQLVNRFKSSKACVDRQFSMYDQATEINDINHNKLHKQVEYLLINKFDLLCEDSDASNCAHYAFEEPLMYDSNHLSLGFAQHIGLKIKEVYGTKLLDYGFH